MRAIVESRLFCIAWTGVLLMLICCEASSVVQRGSWGHNYADYCGPWHWDIITAPSSRRSLAHSVSWPLAPTPFTIYLYITINKLLVCLCQCWRDGPLCVIKKHITHSRWVKFVYGIKFVHMCCSAGCGLNQRGGSLTAVYHAQVLEDGFLV